MTKHPAPPTTERQILVDRIHDRIDALTQTSTTVEQQWRTVPPWVWLRCVAHVVEHASLLDQLANSFPEGSSAESSGGGAKSKPAANIAALSQLQTITTDARRWVEYAFGLTSSDVVTDLLELRSRAATIDHRDDLRELDRDVTRWWAHARVATTWDLPPMRPFVPCEECGLRGGIRVTVEPVAAICLECGAAWDRSTIGAFGEHVAMVLERSIEISSISDDAVETEDLSVPTVLQGLTYSA